MPDQNTTASTVGRRSQAQGPLSDLAFHTLGWKSFQDLCAQVCEEVLRRPVEIYREAQDGGQDAVFLSKKAGDANPTSATVQCKFTSKESRTLKESDLTTEEESILELVDKGEADTYVLMTNMSVSGPTAVAVKTWLRDRGVINAHVFGKEFLTRAVRANARLRALVPRIYGLGDLSVILDERRAVQTKALLGHLLPTLRVYVPTKPHVEAVRALSKHHIALLLGDAATGKSTIAAILAATAAEHKDRPCFKLYGPNALSEAWNPDEPGFYWIDDAFGPNQPREDFIDTWIALMPTVQAAIAKKSEFVLTSRRHIYEAARPKLGTRNHPAFRDGGAIVQVGDLTASEREQILYNHIKAGTQSKDWKARVKPQLQSLAAETSLLPEIARRLGDPAYTKQITTANDSLVRFIREPREHLLQTIEELSKLQRAALTLVFLHRGQMPQAGASPDMQQLVITGFSADAEALGQALSQMHGSFLIQAGKPGQMFWGFKHPTIADAISEYLGKTEGLIELYLRGSKSETILAETVCAGVTHIPDAIVIPTSLETMLVERLAELPDESMINRRLFAFLDSRASESAFKIFVVQHPLSLQRYAYRSAELSYDPSICVHARAHSYGLLAPELRDDTSSVLERSLLTEADTSFLQEDAILDLILPQKLLNLARRVRDEVLPNFQDMATSVVDDADLDIEPESNFKDLSDKLDLLNELFAEDETAQSGLADARMAIENAIKIVEKKKEDREAQEDDEWEWKSPAPGTAAKTSAEIANTRPTRVRSMFSDVDE
jgi:hypothetical protein